MKEEKTVMVDITEQETAESDKPPSITPRPARPWRVAVIANVKGETALPINAPADAGAEFDKKETVDAICAAIESDGHSAIFLPADHSLPVNLEAICPDICFNIAEGMGGDSREAQVPALLEMLHVPYTASRVLANAVALDKTMTKRVWREMGIPTACYQEFITGDEPLHSNLHYPLFVKPAREGTGMGMDQKSIVNNQKELRQQVRWVIEHYRQPALVEEFLSGREFTVAVLGRKDAALYTRRPELYGEDGFHHFPVQEIDTSRSVTPGVYGHHAKALYFGENGIPDFICPADVTPELAEDLQTLAIRGHQAIGSLDVSRVDIRLDAMGKPKLMEINTLPGLSPGFSDLCVISKADNLSYEDLILEILYLGASRYGMLSPRTNMEFEAVPIPLMEAALV
jgi:D-alanine-D-alanine ligase